ncbi:MAG: histidine kinase, partial [Gammaproteobacteria bacterium]|nr:histidine kinase [Gammaproteobacteria bacterium]
TESLSSRSLARASWIFPLFLLLLNLFIPPILWAGTSMQLGTDADYFVLGITLHESAPDWLPLFAFIGGVSAASAMMIVTTLALSSMCLHHLLLPASYPDPAVDLYRWLLWSRRVLIVMIIMAGYGFYILLEHNEGLVQLGLISFVAVAQFLPGVVGVLYWRKATRMGVLLGLIGGIIIWTVTLLVPLLANSGIIATDYDIHLLRRASGMDTWEFATFTSLAVNFFLFVFGSLATRPSSAEREAAAACCSESFAIPSGVVQARSPEQFKQQLARVVGIETAEKEVVQALEDLHLDEAETRPAELRRLRERIERNLSGLIGPQLAHMIIGERLAITPDTRTILSDTVRYADEQLEVSRSQLRGLAAELDTLRRFHRQILMDLPLGVCAMTTDQEVVVWNLSMEVISGISANHARGRSVHDLPQAWRELLSAALRSTDNHVYRMQVVLDGQPRWLNLHKAAIADPMVVADSGGVDRPVQVVLLEDLTNVETLEAELAHSERLAFIGRLAAGVAHEIGNPVTGIACLAQNLREDEGSEAVSGAVGEILVQTGRISDIVKSLMTFSHGGDVTYRKEAFRLFAMVDEAVRLVNLSRGGKEVRCVNSCSEEMEIYGDRQHLLQVLVNLLTNGCDASQPGEEVTVMASMDSHESTIEVRDTGEGIPRGLQEQIFEPFFTTKNPGEGTGLGLPLVYRSVNDHGGTIEVISSPGNGSSFIIKLPLPNGEG